MTTRLYNELAEWWPLLSAPEDYEEEAAIFVRAIQETTRRPVRSVLELGSGGGNNASHMKTHFEMTLSDISPGMLAVSTRLNPECDHVPGDMRTLRLGRTFDAVFIHDAIAYMTTEADLAAAITTAAVHLKPDGVALFVPDETTETYHDETDHGGHDGDGRAIRYLQWVTRGADDRIDVTYVYVLREGESVHVEHEKHAVGVFPKDTWLRLIAEAGLEAHRLPFLHSEFDSEHDLFVGLKPA